MNGPVGSPAAIAARAWSSMRVTTALIAGLRASMRVSVASSTSAGVTSLRRTSSASPNPSQRSRSVVIVMGII